MQTQTNQSVKRPVSGQRIRIAKRCPICGQRLCDKVLTGTGVIEIKCTKCKIPIKIDLALRSVS